MASIDERRAGFKRYKEDVDRRGKPFFPFAMFHDTVMSLVVVLVIIALAVIWKLTADHDGERLHRLARRRVHRQGRPRDDELRAAARLVLLLPLLSAADLQVARVGDSRDDRHPDDLPHAADRAAVRRPADRAAPALGARSRSSPRSSSCSRWACSRTRARRRRRRSRARSLRRFRRGRSSRASRTTRRRSPARSSSRSPAVRRATPISAPAPRTSAHRI